MMKNKVIALLIALIAVAAITPNMTVFGQAAEMPEEKRALYAKYYEKKKGSPEDQKIAFGVAQELVQKYGADDDAYVKAARKFIAWYEAFELGQNFDEAFKQKDYARVFDIGPKILAQQPENFAALIRLAQAGQLNAKAGNTSLNAQALNYAKQAAQMLEANKVTDPAGMTLPDATSYVYFVQGFLLHQNSPVEAAALLEKAVKTTGAYKDDATSYYLIGTSIFNGEFQTLSDEYKAKYAGKEESPEQKAMLDKINALGAKGVDALARAVALSSKPEQAAFKKQVLGQLTDIYKDFHGGSDAGLTDLIASVLSKPLP